MPSITTMHHLRHHFHWEVVEYGEERLWSLSLVENNNSVVILVGLSREQLDALRVQIGQSLRDAAPPPDGEPFPDVLDRLPRDCPGVDLGALASGIHSNEEQP